MKIIYILVDKASDKAKFDNDFIYDITLFLLFIKRNYDITSQAFYT